MLPVVYSGSYELLSCIPAQLICFYVLWSEVDRCQGPVTILVVTHLPTKVNKTLIVILTNTCVAPTMLSGAVPALHHSNLAHRNNRGQNYPPAHFRSKETEA